MEKAGGKQNKGFTLMETLAAVAVMVIVAGLAIPGVLALQRQLYMNKMDEYARQIFVAAQNELTLMKSSGRLERFAGELSGDSRLTEKPADFPETEDEAWRDLYVVSSEEETAVNFLLRASESLQDATERGGCFILELNPLSGDVYSAFYAEDTLHYQTDVLTLDSRSQQDRRDRKLGYYGGGTGDFGTVGLPEAFYPELQAVNGEELYATFTCDGLLSLRRTQRYLTLTLSVEDEHGNVLQKEYRGGAGMFVENDSVRVSLLLDSLEDGKSFAELAPGLTPGDNLTITAAMLYADQNNAVRIQGETRLENVNSLFESKRENGDLTVSRVRHLNNLRQERYAAPGSARVTQSADISFSFDKWEKTGNFLSPWKSSPIERFAPIENNALFTGGAFVGDGHCLSDFVIRGGNGTGLFGVVQDCTLQGIRLADCTITGGSRTGALAGSASGGSLILDCGVYLTTRDTDGRYWNDMETRLSRYQVTGSSRVGGLVGTLGGDSRIEASFAAVPVVGASHVGGLVGAASGTVTGAYASGPATADSSAGGLAGIGEGAYFYDCYATSDVTANSGAGGFLGTSTGGRAEQCVSYGKVLTRDGAVDLTSSGGFAASGGARLINCKYLTQVKYNSDFPAVSGVAAVSYEALRAEAENDAGNSDPYSAALRETPFPFRLLETDGGLLRHYGDWPEEFQLQTSLVYYERYGDGTYGYYARTSLTVAGESAGGNWVVDTLRNGGEACLEDGYAILSVYALEKFDYTLDTGVPGSKTMADTVTVLQTESLTDADFSKRALMIQENVDLQFADQDTGVRASISNARVYRLPFSLQVTERAAATTFWETLTVTGYAHGKPVFKDYTFYYCPDFAKNAVNPDFSAGGIEKPEEPGGVERPVYVRSARQLNGLARATYYWNERGGGRKIQFLQELDINFGTYTGGTKRYCGVAYDLMDTSQSNSYRNKPIGWPNEVVSGSHLINNFRNSYDGQGNEIIDYCCETYAGEPYRFTGLFGEVEGGVLKNIVMTASDPEQGSAYIRAAAYGIGNNTAEPGVGALAGLLYVGPNDGGNTAAYATVSNCAVSGYRVLYQNTGSGLNPAVGGLVGFSFGRIENSSAVCREIAITAPRAGGAFAGGLVGSLNGRGSVAACYSGMSTITVSCGGESYIGGIRGGFKDIYGAYQNNAAGRSQQITNCYTYCTWSSGAAYPVSRPANVTISNCAYLTDNLPENVEIQAVSGVTAVDGRSLSGWSFAGSGKAPAENTHPWNGTLTDRAYDFPAVVAAQNGEERSYVHYGDWPALETGETLLKLTEDAYLVYYEGYGDGTYGFVLHDGQSTLKDDSEVTDWGYGKLAKYNSEKLTVNNREIKVTGSNVFVINDTGEQYKLFLIPDLSGAIQPDREDDKAETVSLAGKRYKINVNFAAAIAPEQQDACGVEENPLQIRTADQLQNIHEHAYADGRWYFEQTRDITIGKSDMVGGIRKGAYHYDGGNHSIIGLRRMLFVENREEITNLHLKDVDISGTGNLAALAGTAGGEVENCSVSGKIAASGNAAGLVYTANDEISNCRVDMDIISDGGSAAGLAYEVWSGAEITNCAVNAAVSAARGNAAGFVWQQNGGSVKNCYVSGAVTAKRGIAAGFCGVNGGDIRNCCAAVTLDGSVEYGFAPWGRTLSKCYYTAWTGNSSGRWCREIDWNSAVNDSGLPDDGWPDRTKLFY